MTAVLVFIERFAFAVQFGMHMCAIAAAVRVFDHHAGRPEIPPRAPGEASGLIQFRPTVIAITVPVPGSS